MTSNKTRLLITPSLLNSWGYIWWAREAVKEAESDEISIDEKRDLASQKAYEDFLKALNREKSEPNEFQLRGIKYEEDTYKGLTDASSYVMGGTFQISGQKEVRVNGERFLMYGRLDCLKGGTIYDIKRVGRYAPGKYSKSYQHGFYMELFPRAKNFIYLAYDGDKLHLEQYFPDECKPTSEAIASFVSWLRENGLYGTYAEKWKSKE